jgi:hypothetical protein
MGNQQKYAGFSTPDVCVASKPEIALLIILLRDELNHLRETRYGLESSLNKLSPIISKKGTDSKTPTVEKTPNHLDDIRTLCNEFSYENNELKQLQLHLENIAG